MKFNNLKDVAEILGMATIVASLIFVGIELRQSQQIAIASQYQSRIGFNLDFYDSFDDQGANRVGNRLRAQIRESNPSIEFDSELAQMDALALGRSAINIRKILFMFDNNQFQYQAGFVDEESWQAMRRRLKRTVSQNKGVRKELFIFEIVGRSYQWRESLYAEFMQIMEEAEKGI